MSEFGSGLVYPVGLFLKHAERHYHAGGFADVFPDKENGFWSMWWCGAADHLMCLSIPDSLPDIIKTKAKELQDIAITYRLPMGERPIDNKEKAFLAIELCTEILFEIDKLLGAEPEKGEWE